MHAYANCLRELPIPIKTSTFIPQFPQQLQVNRAHVKQVLYRRHLLPFPLSFCSSTTTINILPIMLLVKILALAFIVSAIPIPHPSLFGSSRKGKEVLKPDAEPSKRTRGDGLRADYTREYQIRRVKLPHPFYQNSQLIMSPTARYTDTFLLAPS